MEQKIIVSPQHTGTWALIEAFKRLGYSVSEWWEDKQTEVVQAHVGNDQRSIHPADRKKHLSTAMFYARQFDSNKIYCPVRDPLLSIITRQNRVPNYPHWHIIEGYQAVIDSWKRVEIVPVFEGARFRGTTLTVKNSWKDNSGLKAAYKREGWQTIQKALPRYWEVLNSPEWRIRLDFLNSIGIKTEWR